jgi:hypothetical protein
MHLELIIHEIGKKRKGTIKEIVKNSNDNTFITNSTAITLLKLQLSRIELVNP